MSRKGARLGVSSEHDRARKDEMTNLRHNRAALPDVPLFEQVAGSIRSMISDQGIQPGSRVPSEMELAALFGVSRETLRRAVEVLIVEQILARRRGLGTYVTQKRLSHSVVGLHSTRDLSLDHGMDLEARVLTCEIKRSMVTEARMLGLPVGHDVLHFVRCDYVAGHALGVAECFLPADLAGEFTAAELASSSSYELLERTANAKPSYARQTIRAAVGSPTITRWLGLPDRAAILVLDRVTYDEADRALEWGVVSYESNSVECSLILDDQTSSHRVRHSSMTMNYPDWLKQERSER